MKIRANRNRILVKLLPRYETERNPLGLELVDGEKHWRGGLRRGLVTSVGVGVREIKVGDILYFKADAGFSMDGDPEMKDEVYGEGFRWLKFYEVEGVEEPEPVREMQEAI